MIYDLIAHMYDRINGEIDYSRWADFFERIFERSMKKSPELVLDLGCGTGRMTLELAKRGYDMTGVDYSAEMLDIARSEAEKQGADVLWLCQDMTDFELYGTVDAAVSCLDCINHLTTPNELDKCFRLVHNYLIPDGLFIFDVNGRSKFENVYGDNSYVMEQGADMCVWQNYYNKRTKLCDFYITLFNRNGKSTYTRSDEIQTERMYTVRSLKGHLKSAGFDFLGAYSDFEFTPAADTDERIFVVAACRK